MQAENCMSCLRIDTQVYTSNSLLEITVYQCILFVLEGVGVGAGETAEFIGGEGVFLTNPDVL